MLYADALEWMGGDDKARDQLRQLLAPPVSRAASPLPHKTPPAWWGTPEDNAAEARAAGAWMAANAT